MDMQNPEEVKAARIEMMVLKLAYMSGDFTIDELVQRNKDSKHPLTAPEIEAWIEARPNIFEKVKDKPDQLWRIKRDELLIVNGRIQILHEVFMPEFIQDIRERNPSGLHEDGKEAMDAVIEYVDSALSLAKRGRKKNREEITDLMREAFPFAHVAELACTRAARFTLIPAPAFAEQIEHFRLTMKELGDLVPAIKEMPVWQKFEDFTRSGPAEAAPQ